MNLTVSARCLFAALGHFFGIFPGSHFGVLPSESAGESAGRSLSNSFCTSLCSLSRAALLAGAAVLMVSIFSAQTALAKDLSNRLGVGYKNQFSNDLPSVALQYYPGREVGLSAEIGVDTEKDASKFGLMAKIHRIVFEEQNMNFYMGAGLGVLSQQTNGKNDSGFQLMGFAGAEFFLAGLENLGFSFEVGAGVTSISSQVRFQTVGDSPLRAGITFYF